MDIFKQKRYMLLLIILLVIFNVSMLAILWIGRPPRRAESQRPPRTGKEQAQVQRLLKDELGFDKAQIEQFIHIRGKLNEQADQLDEEVRHLKKQMFDEVLQDNPRPMLSDSLLSLALEKQARIEKLTFQYFLDLKKICTPEQQEKLQILIHELFRAQHMETKGGPPPPPDGGPPQRRPPVKH